MAAWLVGAVLNPEPAIMVYKDALVAPRSVPISEVKVEYPEPITEKRITASSTPEEVAVYIAERGEEIGLSRHDTDLALSIAWSESRFRNVPNSKGPRYGIGPFQFVWTTFAKLCQGEIWDSLDNVDCGLKLIKVGQFGHWVQSIHSWKRLPMTQKKLDSYNWE